MEIPEEASTALDQLLRGLRCLLSCNAQVQLLLLNHSYRQHPFSNNIIAAKKLIDSNEQAAGQMPRATREMLATYYRSPANKYYKWKDRIWGRFQARVRELFGRYSRYLDFDLDFGERIFEEGYLQQAMEELGKENARLIRLLYQLVYQYELDQKQQTSAKYEQRLELGSTPQNEVYELLMAHWHFLRYAQNTVVGDYHSANIFELFDLLQLRYHRDLNENFGIMVKCMLKRNEPQQKVIGQYERDYFNYHKKDKKPFFKASLRYHQTIFNKSLGLSVLKQLFSAQEAGQLAAIFNQQPVKQEMPPKQTRVSYLNLSQSFKTDNQSKKKQNHMRQHGKRKITRKSREAKKEKETATEQPGTHPKTAWTEKRKQNIIVGRRYHEDSASSQSNHSSRSGLSQHPPQSTITATKATRKTGFSSVYSRFKLPPKRQALLAISNIEIEPKQQVQAKFHKPYLQITRWHTTNRVKYVQLVSSPEGWRPLPAKKKLEIVVFKGANLHIKSKQKPCQNPVVEEL